MRILITFCFVLITLNALAQDQSASKLNWLTNIEDAKKKSTETKKPILIYFTGSDWCSPCKMLKEDFFSSEKFKEQSNNFVLLMIDVPRRKDIITETQRKQNLEVVKKYNKNKSYPYIIAINTNDKKLGDIFGYTFLRETDQHFAFIDKVLQSL